MKHRTVDLVALPLSCPAGGSRGHCWLLETRDLVKQLAILATELTPSRPALLPSQNSCASTFARCVGRVCVRDWALRDSALFPDASCCRFDGFIAAFSLNAILGGYVPRVLALDINSLSLSATPRGWTSKTGARCARFTGARCTRPSRGLGPSGFTRCGFSD